MAIGGIDGFGGAALLLLTTNGHFSHLDCRRCYRSAKLQIAADRLDSVQHIVQIPRDSHFTDRERQLAVADPESRRAPRIISRDHVHAETHEFRDIESVRYSCADLLGGLVALDQA